MDNSMSITWSDYHTNICKGFGILQQRGEFVDMTIAADGHHVKVHQIVMSLISPYIKELIKTAQCPHPVIFLNRVSHPTMLAILEFAYTGEVMVRKEKIGEFLDACKDLHIIGLDSMMKAVQDSIVTKTTAGHKPENYEPKRKRTKIYEEPTPLTEPTIDHEENISALSLDDTDNNDFGESKPMENTAAGESNNSHTDSTPFLKPAEIQFSASWSGNLQLILNRYIYTLKHTRKNNERYWRCTNQQESGCPAVITTLDNKVISRANLHNHPFHDKQILKRVKNNNIYTSIHEAEAIGTAKKKKKDMDDVLKKSLEFD